MARVDAFAPRADDAPPACPKKDRVWVLTATILASAMGFIDGALLPIALPAIGRDLGAGFGALQWMSNAYYLTLSALIVVGGGLGDRIGRRRAFVFGVAVFALASAACAAAHTAEQLVWARAAQGVGAAFMIPQSLAIISASYPKEERGGAIGLWAAASAMMTTLGPVVGGLFVDTVGWRAAFWINLPLAAACLAIAAWRMSETRDPDADGGVASVDWLGATLLAIGLGAFSWALIEAPERGVDRWAAIALGVSAVAFSSLPWVERRAAQPIAPPTLFRSRVFVAANLVTLLLYGGLAAALFLLPFDLIGARGYSAFEVGIGMLPFGLTIGLLSQPAGALVDRFGARGPLTWGGSLFAFGCAALAIAPAFDQSYWASVLPGLLLMGMALAVSIAPVTTAVMNAAPDALAGAASGVNNAVSRASGLVSVAAVGALTAYAYRSSITSPSSSGALEPDAAAPPSTLADAASNGAAPALIGDAVVVGYFACAALGLAAALIARTLPGESDADPVTPAA